MKQTWKILLILFGILSVVIVLSLIIRPLVFRTVSVVLEKIPKTTEAKPVDITEFDAPLVVKFDAKLPGYTLVKDPIVVRNLQPMMARLGLYPMKDLPFLGEWRDGRRYNARDKVSPSAVFVSFRSMRNWREDTSADPDLSKRLVQSFSYGDKVFINFLSPKLLANNTQVAVTVYVDMTILEKNKTDRSLQLTGIALEAMYFAFHDPPLESDGNPIDAFSKKLGTINGPIFTLTKQLFMVPDILRLVAPPVYAAGCSGTIQCGHHEYKTQCVGGPDNGIPCSNPDQCSSHLCQAVDQGCFFSPGDPRDACYTSGGICFPGDCGGCRTGPCSGGPPPPPPPPGAPPPPPGNGSCGSCCSGGCPAGHCGECYTTPGGGCTWDPGFCNGGGPPPPPADPCPGDTCAGTCCNYGCGAPCIVTADCQGRSSGVQCMATSTGQRCVNPICPNNSIPSGGGACGCSGGILCGNVCAGGCVAGSTCRFTQAPGGNCGTNTYCIGDTGNGFNTFNPAFVTPQCTSGDTGNKMLQRVSNGQTTGFSLADIQSTCQQATIQARAKIISPSDITCAAIQNSTTYLTGTSFSLSPSVAPASQTQSGSSYVSWTSSVPAGTYTLSSSPPVGGYVLQNSCWTRAPTAPTSGQSMAAAVNITDTLTWDLGYSLGTPWVQTQGGDVIVANWIKSLMTPLASPRLFSVNGSGGYPGGVFYGSTGASPYDFDADPASQGEQYVSATNWLANEPGDGGSKDPFKIDWYQYFLYQFDLSPASGATPDYANPPTPITKPASRTKPYLVSGDMTTSGDWVIGNGETIIFLVNGNVTIKGKVNITGTGFVSFIAKGNISIDPTVGVPHTSSAPVVEGFYITSPTGSFITGPSTNAGTERFVGKGSFIAGSFLLQRDLSSVGHNADTAAELFLYNPQLLLTMPEKMKEVKIKWQEVAP